MRQTWTGIHRIAVAESMRAHRELEMDTRLPVDPFLALQRSGVLVMRQPLDRLAGAYLPADAMDGGSPGVLINVSHPLSRQRYTAAHELWHHRRDREIVFDEDTEWLARGEESDDDRERLAEAFASWFLMPKRLVESSLAVLGATIQNLSEGVVYALSLELGTSYAATVRHLHGLNLISAVKRNQLLDTQPQAIKQALGDMDVAANPWRDVRVIGLSSRDVPVTAVEGDVLVLELPETPSSGYLWQPSGVPEFMNLVRDEYRPFAPHALGGNGVHRFVFSLQTRGHRHMRFELSRPWKQQVVAEVRDFDVVSQAQPVSGIVDPFLLIGAAA